MLTLIWVWNHTSNYHIRRLGVRFCYKKKGFYQEKLTIPALLVHLPYRCVTQKVKFLNQTQIFNLPCTLASLSGTGFHLTLVLRTNPSSAK